MGRNVVSLSEVAQTDLPLVGGKAAKLGELVGPGSRSRRDSS